MTKIIQKPKNLTPREDSCLDILLDFSDISMRIKENLKDGLKREPYNSKRVTNFYKNIKIDDKFLNTLDMSQGLMRIKHMDSKHSDSNTVYIYVRDKHVCTFYVNNYVGRKFFFKKYEGRFVKFDYKLNKSVMTNNFHEILKQALGELKKAEVESQKLKLTLDAELKNVISL